MPLNHLSGIKLLISIDFGTTRTGYSFVFVDQVIDDTIGFEYVSKNFNSRHFKNQYKDLSDILLPDGPLDFNAVERSQGDVLGDVEGRRAFFGFEAYERYQLKKDIDAKKALYFTRYKLDLSGESDRPLSGSYYGGDGRPGDACETIDLVALILRYHGQKALADAHKSSFGSLTDDQIRWGITVPAIWEKPAIEMMQEALVRSGLAKDADDVGKRFMLITEPLAAAFAVLRDRRELNERLSPGESLMIVDCGGGTIDTSVIGVDGGGEFEILDFGDGVKRGGSFLNEAISAKFWAHFPNGARPSARSVGYLEFQAAIENAKIGYSLFDEDEFVVAVNTPLYNYLKNTFPEEWQRFSDSDYYLSPFQDTHEFLVPSTEYAAIEKSIYGDIKATIDRVLSKLDDDPKYMFLVGGFAGSDSLQRFIAGAYEGRTQVIIPSRPEKAIVDGALSYILFPERLKLRLQCSYGIEVILPFDDRLHPHDRKFVDATGDVFCKGLFRSFLSKGGTVPIGSRSAFMRTIRFDGGVWPSMIDIQEEVFMSRDGDVTYVDQEGVRVVADLVGGQMQVANGEYPVYEMFFEFAALITIGVTNPDTGRVSKQSFSPIISLTKG